MLAGLYKTQGKFKKAIQEILQAAEIDRETGGYGWYYPKFELIDLNLNGNNIEEANRHHAELWDLAIEQKKALHLKFFILIHKALIHLKTKSINSAEMVLSDSKKVAEEHLFINYLVALLELEKGNYALAIELSKDCLSRLDSQWLRNDLNARFMEPLALAYLECKDFEEAEKVLIEIASLTGGRLKYGHIYAKSFYMLGKIYEQQGDAAKAIGHYEKFLDLWKDADPGIAEVEDAREKLAALTR
jgi:tetratricopeptide (TPR) repeat protein